LAQPWAIAAYKRWFRRGTIDIYETGSIEVGFSYFGPTIFLSGTLRAIHQDMFVRSVSLEVERLNDRSHHAFEWVAFRHPLRVSLTAREDAAVEIVSGFLLTAVQPFRYNVVFADITTMVSVGDVLTAANTEWNRLLFESGLYTNSQQLSQTQVASDALPE